ncbi:MAG: hypothetical protein DI527_00660 [Chelatococcus sp.]|nr:MAG: hypothetical protein DI527_00660 [Chelatococcus sp.]
MASFVGSHADLFVGWPDDPEIPDWASDRLFGPRPVKPPFFSDEAHQDAVEKWSVRRDQTIADILAGRMR